MLLDVPLEELRHLLVDGVALQGKINEAMQVLQQAVTAADAAAATVAGVAAQRPRLRPVSEWVPRPQPLALERRSRMGSSCLSGSGGASSSCRQTAASLCCHSRRRGGRR
jgi:hypothetical protein